MNNPAPAPASGAIIRTLNIVNSKGLHARATAKFVGVVEKHDAAVTVTRGGETVSGNSILGLMMLGAAQGTSIEVSATGPEAAQVMAELERLVGNRFGEEE
jgi:phosphocarrier protein